MRSRNPPGARGSGGRASLHPDAAWARVPVPAGHDPGAKPAGASSARRPRSSDERQAFESLDNSFDRALEGVRQIVFITGEAGMGKTTLVDNRLRAVASRDAVPAQSAIGRADVSNSSAAANRTSLIFEALEHLSRSHRPPPGGVLRTHAPTWLLHMPALISLQDRVRLRDEVFGTTRERMLREITDALEALSAGIPDCARLEDLHWSDPSTIDLLTSIATRQFSGAANDSRDLSSRRTRRGQPSAQPDPARVGDPRTVPSAAAVPLRPRPISAAAGMALSGTGFLPGARSNRFIGAAAAIRFSSPAWWNEWVRSGNIDLDLEKIARDCP